MALSVTIQLNVTPLADNQVWFADAESWLNYWRALNLEATFDPAENAVYTDVPFNTGLPYLDISGGVGDVPTQDQFESLLADYAALKTAYRNLILTLKAAGYIEEAE